MPYFDRDQWAIWQLVDHVNRETLDNLGVRATTLQCLCIVQDPAYGTDSPIYLMEVHDRAWSPPPEGNWFTQDEVQSLQLMVPEHREILVERFFSLKSHESPSRHPPWYGKGWYPQARDWITDEIRRAGLKQMTEVEQLRSSQRSAILRAEANTGMVYFKAVPLMFGHEVPLTRKLAVLFPDLIPDVITVDTDNNRMLMKGSGENDLSASDDVDIWKSVLRSYARIQVEMTDQVEDLLDMGCPDRRLDILRSNIGNLLQDDAIMLMGSPRGLKSVEIEDLRSQASEYCDLCLRLGDFGVPYSLEHGDFAYWQIMLTGSGHSIIDWSDSSVSHPFFSVSFFLDELRFGAPDQVQNRTQLRDAYLEAWTEFEPMDRLVNAFEMSRPLSALHHAGIYHSAILPQIEAKWEWEGMVPYFLKKLL